ncbi:MAG TPA: hypothetical protein VMU96_05725 [Casimicrobiaceae bacterium]|nr:hypothetical protein [Casimicrobiaceae bacterium]
MTRLILAALRLFGLAGVLAIGVAVLAPLDPIRFIGVIAFAFAGAGFLVQLCALRKSDRDAYRRLAFRFRAARKRARIRVARAASLVAAAAHHGSSPRSVR